MTRTVRLYPAYPVMALLLSSEKVVQLVPMEHGETLQVVDVGAALLDDVPTQSIGAVQPAGSGDGYNAPVQVAFRTSSSRCWARKVAVLT